MLSEACMHETTRSEPACCIRCTSEAKLPESWALTSTKLTL